MLGVGWGGGRELSNDLYVFMTDKLLHYLGHLLGGGSLIDDGG